MKLREVMNTHILTLQPTMDVKDAMKKVVKQSNDDTLIDILYVTDQDQLVGVVDLKELIIARSPITIEAIMRKNYHFVFEDEPVSKAIDTVQKYDRIMIPILSKTKTLLGVITAEMALDLLAEETLEDYHKLASLNEYDVHSKPLIRSKKRLPWLLLLLGLSLITASVLSFFEATLQTVIILVLFQPMILDSAGNISTQSLAKAILVINDDPDADMKPFIIKELLIGLMNSTFLALVGFTFSFIFLWVFQSQNSNIMVSFTVGLALFVALLVGAVTGAFVPMILRKLKIDPSVASGPFMTTLNDVIALTIYFSLATLILL
ncbi:magnesium transporter [Paracholeplasma manati]|uniref:magnesium transporter n=1 Tax=Paracholeplasma manati TaxID=591373 RepID=UPI002407BD95|nr:magnesium transporter [Paracholeplasma manati]MDG0889295.1 magnesium transporter [Paracholeplasma manati]